MPLYTALGGVRAEEGVFPLYLAFLAARAGEARVHPHLARPQQRLGWQAPPLCHALLEAGTEGLGIILCNALTETDTKKTIVPLYSAFR